MALVASVIGTRPEAIKMAPVIRRLERSAGIRSVIIATGQHGSLFDQAMGGFALHPDRHLGPLPASHDPEAQCRMMTDRLRPLLARLAPDLVLVQGDTSSALGGARAAASLSIPVGHVEAGLRSHDLARPFPEEGFRIEIDRLSTLLFAPSATALDNIAADPAIAGTAWLTGNSGIDALRMMRAAVPCRPSFPRDGCLRILATMHRRETIGPALRGLCGALRIIASEGRAEIRLPVHPNPDVGAIVRAELEGVAGVCLVAPLPYPQMLAHMAEADLIVSDSGGIQEEASALGTPLLILRDVTERPEAVACGNALLVGTSPETALATMRTILDNQSLRTHMSRIRFPYGRGRAAEKIVTVIENFCGAQNVTRQRA